MQDKQYRKSQAQRFFGRDATEARGRLKKAFRFLSPFIKRDLPVLDIGTRDGWFVEYLKRKKFSTVQGIDIVEEAVKYAQSQGRNVIWGDAHDLSAFGDEEYGTVLMIHSLEHSYNPAKVVEEVYRISMPGGVFFVEVPLEETVNKDVAHFCNFSSIHDVIDLLNGERFELLRSKAYSLGKARHLMCAFRKRQ